MRNNDLYASEEEFRDILATVDEKGKRVWIYSKKPFGKFHRWRIVVSVVLLAIFFTGPIIKIGGRPFLLLNFIDRKFVIFGQPFWPQDFILLAILLITFFVFIILFTVIFGRVWCGWMCPQTLFMEMIFRKIEYWIEGDAPAQKRLDAESINPVKLLKRTFKHTLFIAVSLLISHAVMAYLIGLEGMIDVVSQSPGHNLAGFLGLISFASLFYWIFAKFREQACTAVCPYGRLQGVLLTKDSILVAYDWLRGEPRMHLSKKRPAAIQGGDCIDCKLCVHVCPTGIDIRNGTQLECVNCTACIDACDDVMVKIGKPTGLIRYASYNSIKGGIQKLVTSRVAGYSCVLFGLIAILSFTLLTRSDVKTTIYKIPGTLYQRDFSGNITNLYNIGFVNKTFEEMQVELRVESPANAVLRRADAKPLIIAPEGLAKGVYFISTPQKDITHARTVVVIGVYNNKKRIETLKVKFIGPVTKPADAKRN